LHLQVENFGLCKFVAYIFYLLYILFLVYIPGWAARPGEIWGRAMEIEIEVEIVNISNVLTDWQIGYSIVQDE
jgi:hypothetical protein